MNIVYLTSTDDEFLKLAKIMVESLLENTSCDLIYVGIVTEDCTVLDDISDFSKKVVAFPISKKHWEKNRMAYKIELIKQLSLSEDDQVLVLDSDMYVKKDIFQWFDDNHDVYLTVRPEFFLSANGGAWGFRHNETGKRFIRFFIKQMQRPTWYEFKKYRIKNAHDQKGRDWWMDQDFLCTVNDYGLPFTCSIKKLHCRTHNCTPSKKGMIECLNNPDKHIVHFKGGLKSIWLDYYPKFKRRRGAHTKQEFK